MGATGRRTKQEARKILWWNARKSREMRLARELTKTCRGMSKVPETGIAPEIVWFEAGRASLKTNRGGDPRPILQNSDSLVDWKRDFQIKQLDAHNLQRPETVESLFLKWRITRDPIYRERGWQIFNAFKKHAQLPDGKGFTSMNDVQTILPSRRDNMDSLWLAETLKHLHLLFSPANLLPLTDVVLNTEAHVLPILKQSKFTTGWERAVR